MQVRSLLLETQHNKWESTQRNSLARTEARQRWTPGEKECECPPPVKRSAVKRQLITYIGQFFRCVFTFSQLTGFFSHTWPTPRTLPNMPCLHNFFPRSIPAQRPMGSHFDPPKWGYVWNVLMPQGWDYMTFWTFSQTRFSPILLLPWLQS